MSLPECLTKLDPLIAEESSKPRALYEVIMSRPSHGMNTGDGIIFYSKVPAARGVLTREAMNDWLVAGFRICILREFDELPP